MVINIRGELKKNRGVFGEKYGSFERKAPEQFSKNIPVFSEKLPYYFLLISHALFRGWCSKISFRKNSRSICV